ncbi:MAG: hypothetical protein GEU81_04195 [Nitriliruptorales bacterium]|nr:hypothetical protein [Nitriliruptorales bacterium]
MRCASCRVAAVVLFVLLAGCDGVVVVRGSGGEVRGSGDVVEEDVQVSPFDRIEVSSAFVVEVATGTAPGLTLHVDDNLRDAVDVGVVGGTLRLGLRPDTNVRDATLRAEVTVTDLEAITASGASRIMLDDRLVAEDLALSLSGASRLGATVEFGSADVRLSGSSRTELRGEAEEVSLESSGASRAELADLRVQRLDAELSGSSSATVEVIDTLGVALSGASDLTYSGQPTIERQEVTGAASLSER